MKSFFGERVGVLQVLLVILLFVGLPSAVWLDLDNLADANLHHQARDLSSMKSIGCLRRHEPPKSFTTIRAYQVLSQSREQQHDIKYRFVSDFPFKNRAPHAMDKFETESLRSLRIHPDQVLSEVSSTLLTDRVRLIQPIMMESTCVNCHNSHPESPKRDWKIGDVRGIQEVSIAQPLGANIFAFKYLLGYFLFTAAVGLLFITLQQRQAAIIKRMNSQLDAANNFPASLSVKISRYLSPQVYSSIFSGQKDVAIQTEQKKLTIFFSDINDFTATTERLQPELVTELLKEYFTASR
jgi:adenylate cyclase